MRALVVGGGIVGASAAFHLARAGARVTLVDAAHPGKATLAGAGIVCPWPTASDDPEFYALYAEGARYYSDLIAALRETGETDLGYAVTGALVVSEDPGALDSAETRTRARAATAPEAGRITRLSGRKAQALFPPLRADLHALHIEGGARVDARRLAAALTRAAARLGAEVLHGEVTFRGARAFLGDRPLPADETLLCGGAWQAEPGGVAPQKGQIVHLALPGAPMGAWPVILPLGSHYIVSFEERILIGATRETGSGFDTVPTAAGLAEVLAAGLDIAPGLARATYLETRVGLRPSAARPVVGRQGRFLVGNGLGAAGLTIGPLAGKRLADLALS